MIHKQEAGVNGWLDGVMAMPRYGLVKTFSVQQLAEAKSVKPTAFGLLRYCNDALQVISSGDTDEVRANRARDWFNRFIDGTFLNGETCGQLHCYATDAISWWNEYYADSQSAEEKELWWRQESAAARVWRDEYRTQDDRLSHIRLAIGAAAVGNDLPLQSAEIATEYDCVLDYHGYDKFLSLFQRDPLSWTYHCGRWHTMDLTFKAHGYACNWLLGESGPYNSAVDGWRSGKVLGGDVARYTEAVRTFAREIMMTDAYKTGRFLGFALFTSGGGTRWPLFETDAGALMAIGDALCAEGFLTSRPDDSLPEPVSKEHVIVTAEPYLNARTGPGTHHSIVGRLFPNGQAIEVIERDGDWVKVAVWGHGDWMEDV